MAYKKTIWKNSIFEKPKTFRKQDNADGTFTLVPAFGQVLQDGTKVNADVMNNIENGIEGIEKKVDGIQSPIISVNNKIGIVELTAEDIKCKNGNSIESQMSDMATKKADKTEVQTAQSRADSAYSKAEQAFTLGDSTRKDVVSILSSKGLEGLTTNSNWEQIKNTIQNMSLGKKYAMGSISYLIRGGSKTVNGLDFIPKIIICAFNYAFQTETSVGISALLKSATSSNAEWVNAGYTFGYPYIEDEPVANSFTVVNKNPTREGEDFRNIRWIAFESIF